MFTIPTEESPPVLPRRASALRLSVLETSAVSSPLAMHSTVSLPLSASFGRGCPTSADFSTTSPTPKRGNACSTPKCLPWIRRFCCAEFLPAASTLRSHHRNISGSDLQPRGLDLAVRGHV